MAQYHPPPRRTLLSKTHSILHVRPILPCAGGLCPAPFPVDAGRGSSHARGNVVTCRFRRTLTCLSCQLVQRRMEAKKRDAFGVDQVGTALLAHREIPGKTPFKALNSRLSLLQGFDHLPLFSPPMQCSGCFCTHGLPVRCRLCQHRLDGFGNPRW